MKGLFTPNIGKWINLSPITRKPLNPKVSLSTPLSSPVKGTQSKVDNSLLNKGTMRDTIKSTICSWFIPSLFLYGIEWMSVLIGFFTVLCSLGIFIYPEFMTVVILPILTTCLTNYQTTVLLGSMGIEWIPEVPSYYQIIKESVKAVFTSAVSVPYGYYLITGITTIIKLPLIIGDKAISALIWWNTAVLQAILMGFGFIGLWATLKVCGIIKFIYASTIAAMTAGSLSGIIPGTLTFIMQSVILTFVDPIAALIMNPSLGSLITFLMPDPLGIWNAFISINVVPWTLLREIIVSPSTSWVITSLVQGFIFCWNHSVQDLTWLNLHQNLLISSSPTDIIDLVFGPLDQRLGQIISSVQSLRSIWR